MIFLIRLLFFDSYACRFYKGTHTGVMRLEEFLRKETKNYTRNAWVLKYDIQKFFDSIDHNILKDLLFKKVTDSNTKWLLKNVINSFSKSENTGLPLGNVTSQLFANLYLNEFDQYIKHKLKIKYYIRYCDDFLIISKDEEFFKSLIPRILNFLNENLKLVLHPKKQKYEKSHEALIFLAIFYCLILKS